MAKPKSKKTNKTRARDGKGRFTKNPAPKTATEAAEHIDDQQQDIELEAPSGDEQKMLTNEEIIQPADTYVDDKRRVLWSENNSLGKKPHSLARRPEGVGFTSETGREAVLLRHTRRRASAEDGMVEAAADYLGKPIEDTSGDEAWKAVTKVQAEQALQDGKTAAAKFVGTATDSLPRPTQQEQGIHAETLNMIQLNFRSMDDFQRYLKQQRERGAVENVAFLENQIRDLPEEGDGPIEVKILYGSK